MHPPQRRVHFFGRLVREYRPRQPFSHLQNAKLASNAPLKPLFSGVKPPTKIATRGSQ